MATAIQKNLVEKNGQYASAFNKGHLALPPAKKYLVGERSPTPSCQPHERDIQARMGIGVIMC